MTAKRETPHTTPYVFYSLQTPHTKPPNDTDPLNCLINCGVRFASDQVGLIPKPSLSPHSTYIASPPPPPIALSSHNHVK